MKKDKKTPIMLLLIFLLVATIVFLGIQFFTHTGVFKIPGVVTFDESLSEEEIAFLEPLFPKELVLDNDVKISAMNDDSLAGPENSLLADILVPVTDFYNPKSAVSASEAESMLISLNDLTYDKKLLAIDGNYFLDTFDSGAIFRHFILESKDPSESKKIIAPTLKAFPTKETTLSFAQTGVTALSRGMHTKLLATGADGAYFAEKIKDFLSTKDLTHTSNEASFTNYATANNICSDWRMLGAITAIGTDIIELTGNHNQDCGDAAAIDSIDKYNELGIKVVGGGKTANEASIPLQISEKGTNITMLAYNYSTGGYTLDNTPGANLYTEEKITSDIKAAKDRGDFIIVDIQYFECSEYAYTEEVTYCERANSASGEQDFFRHIIDLGADIVVGTSAHQPQTYELYGNGTIYYGLGNLFFDQVWWPSTTRSLIVTSYFVNGKRIQTRLTPTVFGPEMQTRLMTEEDSAWYLNRLNNAR